MGSYGNHTIGFMDRDLGDRNAPDRALNLKDIYVKMQACIFCACIFEGHVYVLSESFLHLPLWPIFRQSHPNFRGGRNANASEIWAQLTKNLLTKLGTERFRENMFKKEEVLAHGTSHSYWKTYL